MYNIYITSESENKLKSIYNNLKNFYILDSVAFVKSLGIDMTRPTSIFLANDEIIKTISSQAKLKKFKGVIYINKNITESLYQSFKQTFSDIDDIKLILIDNGQFPKHTELFDVFDEVIFYERFKKNKIVECTGFEKNDDNKIKNILMDENNY